MINQLNEDGMNLLFRQAHTYIRWQDKAVSDDTLKAIYDLLKWPPTSMNCTPVRLLFLRSKAAKERLLPALSPANIEKTMSAPVTAIIAFDEDFYQHLPQLFPAMPNANEMFANSPALAENTARRNGSLQGAYFILAARALGLDCGPMSGFDNAKVDEEFFAAGEATNDAEQEFFTVGHIRSNFLCNIGYGEEGGYYPRNVRLEFEEACRII